MHHLTHTHTHTVGTNLSTYSYSSILIFIYSLLVYVLFSGILFHYSVYFCLCLVGWSSSSSYSSSSSFSQMTFCCFGNLSIGFCVLQLLNHSLSLSSISKCIFGAFGVQALKYVLVPGKRKTA